MSKKRIDTSTSTPLRSNPFAALSGGGEPETDGASPGPVEEPSVRESAAPARAVVRYQRKGRGGKEVTLVEKLELPAAELATWASEVKRALGCGGHVEGADLLFAGDQRGRLPEILRARGVRKVTVA